MKKFIVGTAIVMLAALAQADEIMIHGLSYHGKHTYSEDGHDRQYNERNPGITYIFNNGFSLGVYKNSYARTTLHASYRHMFTEYVGAVVGAGTGYDRYGSGLIGGLVLRTPAIDNWRLVVLGQPFTTKYRILTLNLSKEF